MAGVQDIVEPDAVDLCQGADVTGRRRLDLMRVAALHSIQMRDSDALAPLADVDLVADPELTLVHAEGREAADVGIDRDSEHVADEVAGTVGGVGAENPVVVRPAQHLDRVAFEGVRHELRENAQKLPQARARGGRSETDRDQMTPAQRAFEGVVQLIERDALTLLEVELHELVIELDDLVGNLRVRRLDRGEVGHRVGRLEEAVGDPLAAVGRQVQRQAFRAENGPDPAEDRLRVRLGGIDLVDDDEPAELLRRRLGHELLGDELDTVLCVDDDGHRLDGREDRQRPADEIRVARRVEQVDAPAAVLQMADGDVERVPGALFLLGEVGDGVALVDAARALDGAGECQQFLGEGGLARISVTDQGDVADGFRGAACGRSGHRTPPL